MDEFIGDQQVQALSSLGIDSFARRMAEAFMQAIKAEDEGKTQGGIRLARQDRDVLLRASPESIGWHELGYAEDNEPGAFIEIWSKIKQAARDELESGHRAADVVESALNPWVRAKYLALRESFIADWQPTNSVELRVIEMMAQIYTQYEFWMQISIQRAMVDCQQETYHVKKNGRWKAVTIGETTGIEQAAAMADRFNRLFLRTLRALRDLRRYTPPVIVQNAGQVNVGAQQINVMRANKRDSNRKHNLKGKSGSGRSKQVRLNKKKAKRLIAIDTSCKLVDSRGSNGQAIESYSNTGPGSK